MNAQFFLERQKDIKEFAYFLGADLVGFCDLGFSPVKTLPTLRYAVSVAVKLSDAVLKTIENAPSFVYFQHYRAANALRDQIAFRLSGLCRKKRAVLVRKIRRKGAPCDRRHGYAPYKRATRHRKRLRRVSDLQASMPRRRDLRGKADNGRRTQF